MDLLTRLLRVNAIDTFFLHVMVLFLYGMDDSIYPREKCASQQHTVSKVSNSGLSGVISSQACVPSPHTTPPPFHSHS